MDFSIDYGSFAPKPQPRAEGPLYASVGGRASSLANGEVVFYEPAAGTSHVMTSQVLGALDLCREFAPLDRHVERIATNLPGLEGQHAAIRRVLDGLVQRGLLVDEARFVEAFTAPEPALPGFAGIFIRACDRPARLKALLASLLEYEQRFAPRHSYIVVDDSSRGDASAEHRRLLAGFGEAAGVRTRHIDAGAWGDIVAELGRELPGQQAVLRRLLLRDPEFGGRRGGGVGKNLITLLAAGKRYALLDDDFLFPLRRHPQYDAGLRFDPGAWAARTYGDAAAALAAGDEAEGDPLALQLQVCGASLGAVANRAPEFAFGREQLRGLQPSRLPQLAPQRRVLATINGHRGDAGASGVGWMFVLDAEARAGMTADRATYLSALERPAVWHGARAWQVVPGANFTPFMVDNSRLLPCTSPFGRSEDALFAALGATLWEDSVLVNTPYAVGHRQENAVDRREQFGRPETPDINLYLADFARRAELHADDPALRLAALAAGLRDFAAAPDRALTGALREYLAYLRSSLVDAIQRTLAAAKEPPVYWVADLRQVVEANGRALVERRAPRFAGWSPELDEDGCAAAFRAEAGVLADGLQAWPEAWQIALERGGRWLAS